MESLMNKWILLIVTVSINLSFALMDPNNPAVIKVGERVILKKEINDATYGAVMNAMVQQWQIQNQKQMTKQVFEQMKPPPEALKKAQPQVVSQLISNLLFLQEAKKAYDFKVTDEMIKANLDELVRRSGGEAQFEANLKKSGETKLSTREKVAEGILVGMLTQKVTPQLEPPSDKVFKELFEKNKAKLPKNDTLMYMFCQSASISKLSKEDKDYYKSTMKNIAQTAKRFPFEQACAREKATIGANGQYAAKSGKDISKQIKAALAKIKVKDISEPFVENGRYTIVTLLGRFDGKWESYLLGLEEIYMGMSKVKMMDFSIGYIDELKDKFGVEFYDKELELAYNADIASLKIQVETAKKSGAF